MRGSGPACLPRRLGDRTRISGDQLDGFLLRLGSRSGGAQRTAWELRNGAYHLVEEAGAGAYLPSPLRSSQTSGRPRSGGGPC